ncbi:MAG: DUF4386 family protein [Anaerolineae bacterium]
MTTLAQTQINTFDHSESQSNRLQMMGGWSSIVASLTYIFGFALFLTVLMPLASGELDAVETVAFMEANQVLIYIWNLVIYVLNGIVLAVTSLAINERLKAVAPASAQISTALGLIWAGLVIASGMVANIGAATVIDIYQTDPMQAGTIFQAVNTVQNGLGGGNEIVGGLWVTIISWVAFRTGLFSRALNGLGLIAGVAGIVTLIPQLTDVGAIFGLGMIAWFIWMGTALLRSES